MVHYFKDCFQVGIFAFLSVPELGGPSAGVLIVGFVRLDNLFDPAFESSLPDSNLIDTAVHIQNVCLDMIICSPRGSF